MTRWPLLLLLGCRVPGALPVAPSPSSVPDEAIGWAARAALAGAAGDHAEVERALGWVTRLDPSPHGRVATARVRMRQGRAAEAWSLIDVSDAPGAVEVAALAAVALGRDDAEARVRALGANAPWADVVALAPDLLDVWLTVPLPREGLASRAKAALAAGRADAAARDAEAALGASPRPDLLEVWLEAAVRTCSLAGPRAWAARVALADGTDPAWAPVLARLAAARCQEDVP